MLEWWSDDSLSEADGWSKLMKIARRQSSLRPSGGSDEGHGGGSGIGGHFGPLGLGSIALGLGEEEDGPEREGAVGLGHLMRARSPNSLMG